MSADDFETLTEDNLWFLPQFVENLAKDKKTVKDAGFFKVSLLLRGHLSVGALILTFFAVNFSSSLTGHVKEEEHPWQISFV